MAPPPATKNFQQHQPITTTLRTICESYPSNTCLRELLQNADDARATEIEYVLDTNTYTGDALLHADLQDYQGPALLAKNNSVFTDKDFSSLSSVGDSGKRNDLASTGKFGQGFNSVYHWTDGPWIYSRNWLLILDPHERWSNETDKPGGPAWDVIENRDCQEIKNHLKTFAAFKIDANKELDGTVVRIPLRTTKQSRTSKIAPEEIAPDKIRNALEDFGQDIQRGDLLFLKHIRKIIIRVNTTVLLTAQIADDGSPESKARRDLPTDFSKLYALEALDRHKEVSKTFKVNIDFVKDTRQWRHSYLVQHTMARSCGDEDLDLWGRKLKLFPWVAIAAPLDIRKEAFAGTLFSTLSLPIKINQPVHIHGLFAIAPDRARLGFDESEVRWNNIMFERYVSAAWVTLLNHRRSLSWQEEGFSLWPSAGNSTSDPWTSLADHVIDAIIHQKIPVWNTASSSCVSFSQSYFAIANAEKPDHIVALAKISVPAVLMKEALFQKVTQRASCLCQDLRLLTPTSVRSYLREYQTLIPHEAASSILEYCLSDAIKGNARGVPLTSLYSDLDDIPFWPTLDGKLSSSHSKQRLLLPRNYEEMQFFSTARDFCTLDLHRLTTDVQELLRKDLIYLNDVIGLRTMQDLGIDWPTMYPFSHPDTSSQYPQRYSKEDPMIRNIWPWICARYKEENQTLASILHGLWLIPIYNSQIRRLAPGKPTPLALIIGRGEPLADFLIHVATRSPGVQSPIIETEMLTADAAKLLRKHAKTFQGLRLACQNHLEPFAEWLVAAKQALKLACDQEKVEVLMHLEKLIREQAYTQNPTPRLKSLVRQLPLFSKASCEVPSQAWTITLTSVDQNGHMYKIPAHLPPIPNLKGVSFFSVHSEGERYVLEQLDLLEEISIEKLLTQHLLPWMETVIDDTLSTSINALLDWIFCNSRSPSKSWITNIISRPIIPVSIGNGQKIYKRLQDLVNPTSKFSQLYFEEEHVFPHGDFFNKHKEALVACGMSDGVSCFTPLSRARVYAQCQVDEERLVERISCLFKASIHQELNDPDSIDEIRSLRWLPGVSRDGAPVMMSPSRCRGSDQAYLVDKVWGTTPFSVRREWKKLLGWDMDVPQDVLYKQLDCCIHKQDVLNIDRILPHIKEQDIQGLSSRSFILGGHGGLFTPSRAFYPGISLRSSPLAPYVDQIDDLFAKKHGALLEMIGVKQNPSLQDLRGVQDALYASGQGQLTDPDLSIAIASLEVSTRIHCQSADLLIPDTTLKLRRLPDIVHGDRNVAGEMAHFNFTHPAVSEDLIHRLGIENSFERATRLEIAFEDEDEDEYTPREKLSTVISDTLGRYPIETTFNEFLANADDAGATKVSWILDDCPGGPHESSNILLTSELKKLQGPALIVFNNGVFSDKDFAGFKEIGQGGKADDATTTGMFGRGALSMYHFTDVPAIVSGGFYLILDPQQALLPRNRHHKRKVGVKISLATARRVAYDQLLPFHGIHKYDKDLDFYKGTIFRFPFRTSDTKTDLRENTQHPDPISTQSLLRNYFDTARLSLLFLHSVHSIDFSIRGKDNPEWSVSAHRTEGSEDEVFTNLTVSTTQEGCVPELDVWRIGVLDIETSPLEVFKVGKGSSKITECGIAACLEHRERDLSGQEATPSKGQDEAGEAAQGPSSDVAQRVFCNLPTTSVLHLPISFHASFAITGDRKTIAFEGRDDISKWNHWLLTECVADFYVNFLRDLSPRLGQRAFKFWPSITGAESTSTLSGVVAKAFWEKVMNQEHKLDKLYPILEAEETSLTPDTCKTDLRRLKVRKPRKLHAVTAIESARFDFLTTATSTRLQPLFILLGVNLVRPPVVIWNKLQSAAKALHIIELNADFLCRLFKEEANCVHLETFLASFKSEEEKENALAALLKVLVPKVNGDDTSQLDILHGCRILPRPQLTAPLGLLQLNGPSKGPWHFVATSDEQKLFSFASGHMVNTKLFTFSRDRMPLLREPLKVLHDPIADIMKTSFNVRKLEINDLGSILSLDHSPTASTNHTESLNKWIIQFWHYVNTKSRLLEAAQNSSTSSTPITVPEILGKLKLWDHNIYRVNTKGQCYFITPRQFQTGPYVVESDSAEERTLCAEIPNLKCVDRTCLPFLLSEDEVNFSRITSFRRFLKALECFGDENGLSTKTLLDSKLSVASRDILRGLLLKYLRSYSSPDGVPEKAMLRMFPVWPRLKRPEHSNLPQYLAAEDAIFCKHSVMFMPWARDLDQYVDPETVADYADNSPKLSVSLMTAQEFWQAVKQHLPKTLNGEVAFQRHFELIKYLAKHGIVSREAIAPNGRGVLCRAETLYDHDDEIFKDAFQKEQENKFVHMSIQSQRSYWVKAGLRARPPTQLMSHEDYLQCALAVDRQWKPTVWNALYDQAALAVSAYLEFEKSDFGNWPESTWMQIAKVRMFSVQKDFSAQQKYRKARMKDIAQEHTHCSLQAAGETRHLRILWSQVKFLESPPAISVFKKLPEKGLPPLMTVYRHLQFLVDMYDSVSQHDLSEYLKDVQGCYDYLQEHAMASQLLKGIHEARIWFNVDTTQTDLIKKQDLKPSLLSAKFICLNSPADIMPIRVARNFLVPYEKLLKLLGCKSVVQPRQAAPEPSIGAVQFSMAQIMGNICSMRDQGQLTDVTFEAEGSRKSAHKIFLAAVSDHCKAQFSGEWGRQLQHQEIIPLADFRFTTLSTMIDFAYTGEFVGSQLRNQGDNEEIALVLDELLFLLDGTDMWLMQSLHEKVESFLLAPSNSQVYVRVDNVVGVKARAESARAFRLVRHCDDFIAENSDFVKAFEEDVS